MPDNEDFLMIIGLPVFFSFMPTVFAIVHCAVREDKNPSFRIWWVLLIMLTGPLGASLYGLFASGNKYAQWATLVFVVLTGIFLTAYLTTR